MALYHKPTISTHLQITFDTVLYSWVVYTQGVSRALFSVGVIDTWGAYNADVREANLCSCVCLVLLYYIICMHAVYVCQCVCVVYMCDCVCVYINSYMPKI